MAAAHASDFGETSEALFLTSGFRYQRAEDAAERFAGRQPGFIYSRLANPTVRMFEERLALLEGAEDAAATATGMAAVHAALMASSRPATGWSRRASCSAPATTS